MSCKGARLTAADTFEPFEWSQHSARRADIRHGEAAAEPARPAVDVEAIERDAFARGFMEGERSGAQSATSGNDVMRQRLAQTIDDVAGLRPALLVRVERQVVQLSLAIAARIVHREVAHDRELLITMARVALDRLGDSSSATIRLHPDDHTAVANAKRADRPNTVRVVADPLVSAGGCLIDSEYGHIDVGVDAQLEELANGLLASDAA
jgi:flagellar assembly protein FliH